MIATLDDVTARRPGPAPEDGRRLPPDAARIELVLGRSLVGEVTENLSRVAFIVAGRSLRLIFGFYEHPCLADAAAVAAVHDRVARAFPLLELTDETGQGMPPARGACTVFARK